MTKPGFVALDPAVKTFGSGGMCQSDGKSRFVYYLPKENAALHLKLPAKEGQGVKMTWFDPHTGKSEPLADAKGRQRLERKIPGRNHFAVPLVKLTDSER